VESSSNSAALVRTGDDPAEARLALCEALLVKQRLLARHAPNRLFLDPAWNILVELYMARARHLQISFTSLAYGANVPLSTASRLVQEMERHDLVTRVMDAQDRRRTFLHISKAGEALVTMILDGIEESRARSAASRLRKGARWRAALGSDLPGKARRFGMHR
jgi:DNA-binding MarR family transcriptional regulator